MFSVKVQPFLYTLANFPSSEPSLLSRPPLLGSSQATPNFFCNLALCAESLALPSSSVVNLMALVAGGESPPLLWGGYGWHNGEVALRAGRGGIP